MKTPTQTYRSAVLPDTVEEHPDFLSLHTIDRHELQNRGHKKILFSQQSKTHLGMNQHSSKRQMSYTELNKRKWEAVNVTKLLASLPLYIRKEFLEILYGHDIIKRSPKHITFLISYDNNINTACIFVGKCNSNHLVRGLTESVLHSVQNIIYTLKFTIMINIKLWYYTSGIFSCQNLNL